MEYSLYDARRAGFGDAVFVIRDDLAEPFAALAATRFGTRLSWRTVIQRLEDVPSGVPIPTGRASPGAPPTPCSPQPERSAVPSPCSTPTTSTERRRSRAASFSRRTPHDRPPSWAIVGYRLRDTLSDAGVVNRGICRIGADGWLESVEEVTLEPAPDGRYTGGENRASCDSTVTPWCR
jgi:hypothetical protein